MFVALKTNEMLEYFFQECVKCRGTTFIHCRPDGCFIFDVNLPFLSRAIYVNVKRVMFNRLDDFCLCLNFDFSTICTYISSIMKVLWTRLPFY